MPPQQHRFIFVFLVWLISFAVSGTTGGTLYSSIFSAFLVSVLYMFCILFAYPFSGRIVHFPIFVISFYLMPVFLKWVRFDGRMINQRVSGIDIIVDGELLVSRVALLYAPFLIYGILIYQIPTLITAAQNLWGKNGDA